jgi:hypothetical protein
MFSPRNSFVVVLKEGGLYYIDYLDFGKVHYANHHSGKDKTFGYVITN